MPGLSEVLNLNRYRMPTPLPQWLIELIERCKREKENGKVNLN